MKLPTNKSWFFVLEEIHRFGSANDEQDLVRPCI